MRSRKTYSAAHHKKKNDFDLSIYYTVYQERKNQKDITTTKHTHNTTEFFHGLFACNQYVLKQIIAPNFISKTHDSDQLITTNLQQQKTTNNTMQCNT